MKILLSLHEPNYAVVQNKKYITNCYRLHHCLHQASTEGKRSDAGVSSAQPWCYSGVMGFLSPFPGRSYCTTSSNRRCHDWTQGGSIQSGRTPRQSQSPSTGQRSLIQNSKPGQNELILRNRIYTKQSTHIHTTKKTNIAQILQRERQQFWRPRTEEQVLPALLLRIVAHFVFFKQRRISRFYHLGQDRTGL